MESLKVPKRIYQELPLAQIRGPSLPLREQIDERELEELTATILVYGVLQPIIVTQVAERRYDTVIGDRRLRASRLARVATIPAIIVNQLTNEEVLILALIENFQRRDLEPLEEARGLQLLKESGSYDVRELAKEIKKSETFVKDRLALLDLAPTVQRQLKDKRLPPSHASAIALLPLSDDQENLAKRVITANLSYDLTKRIVTEKLKCERKRPAPVSIRRTSSRTATSSSATSQSKERVAVQEIVIKGERFLKTLEAIPFAFWKPDDLVLVRDGLVAVDRGIQKIIVNLGKHLKKK